MEKNNLPKKSNWKLMYEGPDLGHFLANQIFIKPFSQKNSLLNKLTGFKYDYYLWYSDENECGGIHGGYYQESDLRRALEKGEKLFFNKKWLEKWYQLIDSDSKKVGELMEKYSLEKNIKKYNATKLLKIIPKMITLEYRLLSYVRCSQPQLTDALKNKLYKKIRRKIKNEKTVEKIFNTLTMPEEKSFFTEEEIAWLSIIIEAEEKIREKEIRHLSEEFLSNNYLEIFKSIKNHLEKYSLIPASDRTPAWDIEHFIELLKNNLRSDINHQNKQKEIINQYKNSKKIKENIIRKYNLEYSCLEIGSRIAKVGFYRFKASFYWRWMGYYLVLISKRYSKKLNISFKEITSLTEKEFIEAIKSNRLPHKKYLSKRATAELYLHQKGKNFIWWGDEAIKKKKEFLGNNIDGATELKGEIGSMGMVKGRAFVFYWSDNIIKKMQSMRQGDILVAPQTHPTYMPAIRMAQAMVCDEGGVTGHAAIVARELKKPCVIGLHTATKIIKTGDEIEVDANKGIVRIIKRK
ncbi:MAG TPA: PEP-utilizing enzyme [Candidatus Moranbacteria bacterium]|nr:PEP-utilizing enzyme [Candidatus Moranbacteria bacterium]